MIEGLCLQSHPPTASSTPATAATAFATYKNKATGVQHQVAKWQLPSSTVCVKIWQNQLISIAPRYQDSRTTLCNWRASSISVQESHPQLQLCNFFQKLFHEILEAGTSALVLALTFHFSFSFGTSAFVEIRLSKCRNAIEWTGHIL